MIYMTKIDVFEMMNKLRALKIANNNKKNKKLFVHLSTYCAEYCTYYNIE